MGVQCLFDHPANWASVVVPVDETVCIRDHEPALSHCRDFDDAVQMPVLVDATEGLWSSRLLAGACADGAAGRRMCAQKAKNR